MIFSEVLHSSHFVVTIRIVATLLWRSVCHFVVTIHIVTTKGGFLWLTRLQRTNTQYVEMAPDLFLLLFQLERILAGDF